jgi:hypothetical protein
VTNVQIGKRFHIDDPSFEGPTHHVFTIMTHKDLMFAGCLLGCNSAPSDLLIAFMDLLDDRLYRPFDLTLDLPVAALIVHILTFKAAGDFACGQRISDLVSKKVGKIYEWVLQPNKLKCPKPKREEDQETWYKNTLEPYQKQYKMLLFKIRYVELLVTISENEPFEYCVGTSMKELVNSFCKMNDHRLPSKEHLRAFAVRKLFGGEKSALCKAIFAMDLLNEADSSHCGEDEDEDDLPFDIADSDSDSPTAPPHEA